MTAKTNYLEDAILNHVLRNSAMASPAAVYIAAFTSAPGEAGGGTEVSGNGYARQSVAFGAPSSGAVANTATITFPTATPGAWGLVTHAAIFDSLSGGNMLYYGALGSSKQIDAGDALTFQIGQIVIAEN